MSTALATGMGSSTSVLVKPSLTFILADGSQQVVSVRPGTSAMAAAQQAGLPGILAECGGACTCATCHVYVEPSCLAFLPEKSVLEDDMLDAVAAPRQPNSRLSCQIKITAELDGKLTLRIPDRQTP